MGKKIVGVRSRGRSTFRINYRDAEGKRHFETVDAESAEAAASIRAMRLGDIAHGLQISSKPNTILIEELAADVVNDYVVNNRASLPEIKSRFRLHILPVFRRQKVSTLTTAQLNRYILQRLEEGAKPGTINREMEAIRHALKMGAQASPPKVVWIPKIPRLKENNVRKGFFEREQLEMLCRHLPKHLIAPVRFGYITGWRHGEVFTLRRRHVHMKAGEVHLEPGETKNDEGRTFPMVDELRRVLAPLMKKKGFPNDLLFTSPAGTAILRFDKSWRTACAAIGLPVRWVEKKIIDKATGKRVTAIYKRGKNKGKPILTCRAAVFFHDFRRTAFRNLVRLGVPEGVARDAVGWKDAKTAARYNITAKSDLDVLREKYDSAASGANSGANRTKNGQ